MRRVAGLGVVEAFGHLHHIADHHHLIGDEGIDEVADHAFGSEVGIGERNAGALRFRVVMAHHHRHGEDDRIVLQRKQQLRFDARAGARRALSIHDREATNGDIPHRMPHALKGAARRNRITHMLAPVGDRLLGRGDDVARGFHHTHVRSPIREAMPTVKPNQARPSM